MARYNKGDFSMEIEEFVGAIKESDKHDWCKAVARISWNGEPATVDIRNINVAQGKAGKGISLADEDVDRLVDILLDNDYGSLESLTEAINRKKSRFTIEHNPPEVEDEKGMVIQINLGDEYK